MPLYTPDTLNYSLTPADRNHLAETMGVHLCNAGTAQTGAGTLAFTKLRLPVQASVTNVVMNIITAGGSALTTNQCIAGLYTGAGAKVGITADQSVAWATTGLKTMALTGGPFTCDAGLYYVVFWYNGTTGPTWLRAGGPGSVPLGTGLATPNFFYGSADSSLTTTATAPLTLGTQTSGGTAWWAALS